ncbi:MAG: sodium:calcium antiporter [Bacteroidales bacterium]
MFLGILIPILIIILSSFIIWKSTDSFETAADYLGRNMSRGVKGATINAIASSMPEFLTTMFFLFCIKDQGEFADSFSGGLGVTAGSAVFNILIIPFAILTYGTIKLGSGRFPVNRSAIYRDGLVLLLANIILILIIRQERLDFLDGLLLVLLYLFYLFTLRKGFGKKKESEKAEDFSIAYEKIGLNHFFRIDLKQILFNGKKLSTFNSWVALIASTGVMAVGTWLLVEGTELLGHDEYTFWGIEGLRGIGVPIIFLSVIFAAAATSIPDTMISIRDARKGNHIDSISNALGSNIFDISFAIGLPLLLFTHINGSISMSENVRVWSLSVWLVMFLINLIVLPIFIHSKTLSRRKGLLFLLIYILFIVFIVEENTTVSWFSNLVHTYFM